MRDPWRLVAFSGEASVPVDCAASSAVIASWISSGDASRVLLNSPESISAGSSEGASSDLGGGGMGALFASPIRRSVIVNCAFVGTPRRIVLKHCQNVFTPMISRYMLPYF